MAEETVMASVRYQVFVGCHSSNLTMSPISLKFYLDANDISGPQGKLSVTANGGSIPVGSETSDAAATLINAINAIPTDQTIQTTIEMRIRFGSGWSDCGPFDSSGGGSMSNPGSISIIIDWVNNQVTWNGLTQGGLDRYNGSDTVPGNLLIERLNGSGQVDEQESFMLGTTEERKISRLPIPGFGHLSQGTPLVPKNYAFLWALGSWDGQINVDYVITTDKGTAVIAAPTPPPPVVSVKISELPETTSLQNDDLFVLSQDKSDDGTYDISHRVTLANLKASIAGLFAPAITDSDVMSVLQRRDTGFSGTVSLTPPTGKKFAILSCQLDCNASGSGGNWLLVIGKNLDTDLPVGTYPAGTGKSYSAAQFDEIYKYSVSETSNTLTDPNGTNTNLRYVYVGDGGTVSMPWRILINNGPSGAVAVTITLVGWA